jgi:transglutaminase-like putative cysteine protease
MYMKKNLVIVIAMLAAMPAIAQNISYVLSSVSEPVKKNAHVITRYENQAFEVTDLDRATINVHRVVTIVDARGKREQYFVAHSSKYRSLDDVEIKVYDASGKLFNKYRKKDMSTVASGEGLIEDGFVTYFEIPIPGYPVTIETKYEIKFRGTLNYPTFYILNAGEGVEIASYTAKVPRDLDLRYKENNINLKPEITEDTKSKTKTYKWTVNNLSPVQDEEGAVSSEDRFPSIQIAPNKFSQYSFEGDISSWKSFGQWIRDLYKGLDELPEERKSFYRALVKNASSDEEKIRIIYRYMQKNFRYVSIQLGVGGLRPFSAEFTDSKKYGDCKGLSNYMKAALKAVGIPSHVAIINAGYDDKPVDPSFPMNDFNHVILCVPRQQDSIWLECTSNTADFGVLGTFTENRNALLITDDGGVLVPTPRSNSKENLFMATTTVSLQEDGSGTSKTTIRSAGDYRESLDALLTEKKDDQKEYLVHQLGFKQPDVFELTKRESTGMHTTSLEMSIEKVPEFVAGNKMFINPRLYKIWSAKLPKAENRKLDFYFPIPFEKTDTTILQLPQGYTMDALPKDKALSCPYATYTTKYWFNEEQKAIYSTTQLVLKQHTIPAVDYAEVKKFFDDILLDDAQRVVIKKP